MPAPINSNPEHATVPRPDDPDAELTPEEEDFFALLVEIADANEEASRDRRAGRRQAKEPPKSRVDFSRLAVRARAIRFLFDYASGVPPSQSLRALGLSWGDVQICRFASREYERVYQLVRYQAGERMQDKALEAIERALDGVDIGSAAASSARFILERLARGDYADPRYKYLKAQQGGELEGPRVAYQINIINTSSAPASLPDAVKIAKTSSPLGASLCGECVDGHAESLKTPEKIAL